jgi:hypothetical protein
MRSILTTLLALTILWIVGSGCSTPKNVTWIYTPTDFHWIKAGDRVVTADGKEIWRAETNGAFYSDWYLEHRFQQKIEERK